MIDYKSADLADQIYKNVDTDYIPVSSNEDLPSWLINQPIVKFKDWDVIIAELSKYSAKALIFIKDNIIQCIGYSSIIDIEVKPTELIVNFDNSRSIRHVEKDGLIRSSYFTKG